VRQRKPGDDQAGVTQLRLPQQDGGRNLHARS
jgi:hypothetical protein